MRALAAAMRAIAAWNYGEGKGQQTTKARGRRGMTEVGRDHKWLHGSRMSEICHGVHSKQ